ncbi:MAG: phospho-N-acetylmuramoyl-pentapeptide-transferase [Gammaproteobacteria bacterium]|uniref:Phospho-N-acetylmuramoyl-pentapeptide-transferase n=1 Tax=OM182 bacterium TaxID=2510334 RepID=A0A520RYH6_9GAMM|nr:phospho-N-acetylmuramoyl-pentapeptide-transferase [Gammaproteobacteria bacterium]RZO75269.1 MAG: phospho-N-acetylmuramoyl-pentapeptide-transferase [OM182 bacterium]
MLYHLAQHFADIAGPFRLLTSYILLAGIGTACGALLTWWLMPQLWHYLPIDKGRAYAIDADKSIGKPMSGGIIFIPIFIIISLLVVPFDWKFVGILACVGVAMLVGFFDDNSKKGWSEYRLGAMDLVVALLASLIICELQPVIIWLPVYKDPMEISPLLFVIASTVIIWTSINATNCTDGVDGLSASLSSMAILFLGGILYGIVGHADISEYLLVPHYEKGADWAIMSFVLVGCLTGYLWHNSYPSAVMMGDSGSRPIGLMLGVLVMASGNPFLIIVVAFMVLVNGATGMIKVALLRFFKVGIFRQVRYPLHDHVRHNMGWSNTQVLVRFMLLQAVGTPILLVLLLKIR